MASLTIGEKIQQFRNLHRLSRKQLGEKLHVDGDAVAAWETGSYDPPEDKIREMERLFHTRLREPSPSDATPFCTATTRWSEELLVAFYRTLYKKVFAMNTGLMIFAAALAAVILIVGLPQNMLFLPLGVAVYCLIRTFTLRRSIKKRIKSNLEYHPDRVTDFRFFDDHMEVHSHDAGNTVNYSKDYTEIRHILHSGACTVVKFSDLNVCLDHVETDGDYKRALDLMKKGSHGICADGTVVVSEMQEMTLSTVLWALFFLCFATLPVAIFLVSRFAAVGAVAATVQNMWLFFLMLPVPVASLLLGIYCNRRDLKGTKNVVVGIVFTVLLLILGSTTLIFHNAYSHDYTHVSAVETEVGVSLPDSGDIATKDWTDAKQLSSDDTVFSVTSNVKFTNTDEIAAFKENMASDSRWLTAMESPLSDILPADYASVDSQYDDFLLYNADTGAYDTVPDKSGTYHFVLLAFDDATSSLLISEYSFNVDLAG